MQRSIEPLETFLGIHLFKCFQFWLWDRAIKTHRLSYRESTINKVSALFARRRTSPSNSKPFERNHDWPFWYRGPPSLSHVYIYRHACYQRSTEFFAVCCQRRWKKSRNFVNSALSVGKSVSFYSPISVKILTRADFWFVIPTKPPEPFESFMMVFSVPISLQIPLKLPHVCLMERIRNLPLLDGHSLDIS
jgi:hypothetical protein